MLRHVPTNLGASRFEFKLIFAFSSELLFPLSGLPKGESDPRVEALLQTEPQVPQDK